MLNCKDVASYKDVLGVTVQAAGLQNFLPPKEIGKILQIICVPYFLLL